jgi:hypothetical protein
MKFDDILAAAGPDGEYDGDGENLSALFDFILAAEDLSTKEREAMKAGYLIASMYVLAMCQAGKTEEAVMDMLNRHAEWDT